MNSSDFHQACLEIVDHLVSCHKNNKEFKIAAIQSKIGKKYKLKVVPTLFEILSLLPPEFSHLKEKYKSKPIRTISGVAVIAVMCKPHRCPHIYVTGNICVYCPGGVDSDFEYSTQSYTGYEPTSMRAIRHRYDPYQQALYRLHQLKGLGHSIDKIEYIIMGGTFMSLPVPYRKKFISDLHDALSGHRSISLEQAIRFSEKSKVKCVGITIETRPDFCAKHHITEMLEYGCTRIEIGVQSTYEDVARDTNRGHTVQEVADTFCMVKDAGYKIVSHMMPNLPNVNYERDYAQFIEFFENPKFRSDGLKIYPTLVIRNTGLYELWKNKKYVNYSPDLLVDFLARILALVPPWTRIYRVQRDIPMPLVSSGVQHGNIREIAMLRMKDYGLSCRDVRSREVGIKNIQEKVLPTCVELIRRDYSANNGWETFLSYEDSQKDILIGMLRLRKCSVNTFRKELVDSKTKNPNKNNDSEISRTKEEDNHKFDKNNVLNHSEENLLSKFNDINIKDEQILNSNVNLECKVNNKKRVFHEKDLISNSSIIYESEDFTIEKSPVIYNDNVSIIRELHVYGTSVPVNYNDSLKYQHQGFGKLLIREAERIAKEEHLSNKIAIIAGIGTRDYYRKFGYVLEGPYMIKNF